jgi:hypothetical protein
MEISGLWRDVTNFDIVAGATGAGAGDAARPGVPMSLNRLYSTLGYVSPMQFERDWYAAQNQRVA